MNGRAAGWVLGALVVAATVWLLWPANRPMPDATFNLVDGQRLSSADLRGRPVLINFWSVSCGVCLRDMPRLTRLHETLGERGLVVIGVAMPHDPPPAVIATVKEREPGYRIAVDVHGELSRAFGDVSVTPTTFLVDPDGNIRFSSQGPLDEPRIRATVATFRTPAAG
jgi:peroxiredoxin